MGSTTERNIEELKSLVLHTLETNGVLGQIRAQLRANVYKAIDDDEESPTKETNLGGPVKLKKSRYGKLMAEVVAEFFEFYDFKHSLSVFAPESNLRKARRSRTDIALEAGLARALADVSILEQLIGLATGAELRKTTPSPQGWDSSTSSASTTASSPSPQPSSLLGTRRHRPPGTEGQATPPTSEAPRGVPEPAAAPAPLYSTEAEPEEERRRPKTGKAASPPLPSREAPDSGDAPEEVPEEAGRERRKPPQVGRLAALKGSTPGSLGSASRELGPHRQLPLGGGALSDRPITSEEVSLADSMQSRDSLEEVDRRFQARIDQKIQMGACLPGLGGKTELAAAAAAKASPRKEPLAPLKDPPMSPQRSRSPSPARSRDGSPGQSPVHSRGPSPVRSPARSSAGSPARSQAASMVSPVASVRSVRSGSISARSRSASPSRSGDGSNLSQKSAASRSIEREAKGEKGPTKLQASRSQHSEESPVEESVSIDDNDSQASSGSLDLTGEPLGGGATTNARVGGASTLQRSSLSRGTVRREESSSGSSIQGAESEVHNSDDNKF